MDGTPQDHRQPVRGTGTVYVVGSKWIHVNMDFMPTAFAWPQKFQHPWHFAPEHVHPIQKESK